MKRWNKKGHLETRIFLWCLLSLIWGGVIGAYLGASVPFLIAVGMFFSVIIIVFVWERIDARKTNEELIKEAKENIKYFKNKIYLNECRIKILKEVKNGNIWKTKKKAE